jgi:hypothetical protein
MDGKAIYYIADIIKFPRVGVNTLEKLPAREYRKLIENHHNRHVYKEKGSFKYWQNKTHRILKCKPEIQFNMNLYSYLDLNVVDGYVERGATISGSEDRTDIRIITFEDVDMYIMEIKCLGKAGSTKYNDDWANEGLIQLCEYLKDEKVAKTGILIIYDGRVNNEEITWNSNIKWHQKIDKKPMRFFLESESASVKAKRIHKEIKKKS